ncbi:MAG: GNAT family N-acetyltransferase [bacterium]|nr:MAG: GNAT family N-acetyltransferase [bacterium]
MEIIDLKKNFHRPYFCCLEEWSEDLKEAGDHKENWFRNMQEKGLRVKLALENEQACGMIQYLPVEHSFVEGKDLYVILCIWVHGHKQGVGNRQKRGIGKALLQAAEEDIRSMNMTGVAAWGISFPFWMKASWFKKQGYRKVDKNGMAVLVWKPFRENTTPPRWIREKKRPSGTAGKVTVTSLINGWCPAQNMVHERAKRAVAEFGDKVEFQEIRTDDRIKFEQWGIADALFIDGKQVRTGPPPSFEKIRKKISKKIKRL